MIELVKTIEFPESRDLQINMMPILLGDPESVPEELRGYAPLISACLPEWARERETLRTEVGYLSIHEGVVEKGKSQRRPGVHTEGGLNLQDDDEVRYLWGGSMRYGGLYMASTDGRCRIWPTEITDVDHHGRVLKKLKVQSQVLDPNTIYWLTDRTPHESLQAKETGYRQWFRLVVGPVSAWWAKHNTANPLGIAPAATIRQGDKFN